MTSAVQLSATFDTVCSKSDSLPSFYDGDDDEQAFLVGHEAWVAIEPHHPKNQPGARRVDDRRVISGFLHVMKAGCRWQDCPAEYGPPTTIYNRFSRWSRRQL